MREQFKNREKEEQIKPKKLAGRPQVKEKMNGIRSKDTIREQTQPIVGSLRLIR